MITVYFYKPGNLIKTPEDGIIIYGNCYSQIEHKGNSKYTEKERIKRDNQMFIDGLFKFIRSKDKKFIDLIGKYSRF